MSDAQLQSATAAWIVGDTCSKNGSQSDLPAAVAFLDYVGSQLRSQDPARVQAMIQAFQPDLRRNGVTPQDCNKFAFLAAKHQIALAEQQRRKQEYEASLAQLNATANSMQVNTPRATKCQYYAWGNMVSCY
ncbi:hypothetical protein [Defluviimonas sp. WL0075]|uniref:Uncharacterized protein n=1 Tax=Albidovulum sediminicola TaxID=2984331 RepID=A0ABT2Z127_9RHOB|nr:hypothetical protein [Defluviimonas sp. WL0075]MCV2864842.1 hypothetical protein [Defluviimonas sp. WL0075]